MDLTYRSNAVAAREDTPALRALDLPEAQQVEAAYALTTRTGAGASAELLAVLILSTPMQGRLRTLGFAPLSSPNPHDQTAERCPP